MKDLAREYKVSLNAVVYFMRHHNLERRSKTEGSRLAYLRKPASFTVKESFTDFENELRLAGIFLYWGEGYKRPDGKSVDFANSDPTMVIIFLRFLREICCVDESKIRLYLYCYENQNPKELIAYWCNLLKLPKSCVTKPYVRKDFQLEKIGRMKYGLIHIRYHDKKLLTRILEWIEEYKKKFA